MKEDTTPAAEENDDGLNPRQRRFVEFYTGGMAAGRAYEAAGYAKRGADQAASLLLRNIKVEKAVKAAKRALSEASRWEKWNLADWYQSVLETPLGAMHEMHLLATEVIREEVGGGANGQLKRGDAPSGNELITEEVRRVKIKMVSKMEAAKELAKLMGWNAAEKVEVTASEEVAAALAALGRAQPVIPDDKM